MKRYFRILVCILVPVLVLCGCRKQPAEHPTTQWAQANIQPMETTATETTVQPTETTATETTVQPTETAATETTVQPTETAATETTIQPTETVTAETTSPSEDMDELPPIVVG